MKTSWRRAKQILWLFAICLTAAVTETAFADQQSDSDTRERVLSCREIKKDNERLSCYDEAAVRLTRPRFQGRLGLQTDKFELKSPHKLIYKSYGVIFVLYLKDADGNVLQNLHVGGGGEGSYTIKSAGTYSLKIHGSAAWAIWLEPQ